MIKHIVAWNYQAGLSDAEKQQRGEQAKEALEALPGVVPGLASLTVSLAPLDSSDRAIVLEAAFETPEALEVYAGHSAHVAAAAIIGSFTTGRVVLDYEV